MWSGVESSVRLDVIYPNGCSGWRSCDFCWILNDIATRPRDWRTRAKHLRLPVRTRIRVVRRASQNANASRQTRRHGTRSTAIDDDDAADDEASTPVTRLDGTSLSVDGTGSHVFELNVVSRQHFSATCSLAHQSRITKCPMCKLQFIKNQNFNE